MIRAMQAQKMVIKPQSKTKHSFIIQSVDLNSTQHGRQDNEACLKKCKNAEKSKDKLKSTKKESKNKEKTSRDEKIMINQTYYQTGLLNKKVNKGNKRLTASQDKLEIKKLFKRSNKQKNNQVRTSKKDSKRSTDNQNEETIIERLKTENQFYRKAYLESKQSLDKISKNLSEEKKMRSNEKQWYKHQINNLKKHISTDKIKIGHIFSFEAYKNEDVSNMIIETDNESSSIINPAKLAINMPSEVADSLSDLSIQSK